MRTAVFAELSMFQLHHHQVSQDNETMTITR